MLSVFQTDSLKKIRNKEELENLKKTGTELSTVRLLRGEHYTYEIIADSDDYVMAEVTVTADLPYEIYEMKVVPADFPTYETSTGAFLTREPGMIPDLLYPLEKNKNHLSLRSCPAALFLDFYIPEDYKGSTSEITVTLTEPGEDGTSRSVMTMLSIEISRNKPEKNPIHFTQWFHTDCIAVLHHVPVYSEAHWALIEKYMLAAKHLGINLILTPVLTPALDTAPGHRRPSVQLTDITLAGEKNDPAAYRFDFSKVDRFMALAEKCGITDFEISHLFSQWGLRYAPNIEAYVNCEKNFIFGWDTEAAGEEYTAFLQAFLPALIAHLEETGRLSHCFFHLSDEPSLEHLETYRRAHDLVCPYLKGRPIMDAMSDYDFYKEGLIDLPVTASNHLAPFLQADLPNQWTYTCCAQHKEVANRFMAMPSFRNRILGLQMYKFGIKGFLHWGFNFYYTAGSVYPINPYLTTSAGESLPSGDPFTVYPGEDGPLYSVRGLVFRDALQDMELLKTAEKKLGKEAVLQVLDRHQPLTFENYEENDDYILDTLNTIRDKLF